MKKSIMLIFAVWGLMTSVSGAMQQPDFEKPTLCKKKSLDICHRDYDEKCRGYSFDLGASCFEKITSSQAVGIRGIEIWCHCEPIKDIDDK